MGIILMEVRAALRKSTWNQEAMMKSPPAIVKAVSSMSDEIQQATLEKETSAVISENFASLPVIKHTDQLTDTEDMDVVEQNDSATSTENEDELLEATDVDEESVNISASSSTSVTVGFGRASAASRMNVTREDGKLYLEKIRKWSIPKLNKNRTGQESGSEIEKRRSQRLRRTLPFTSPQPGTPQVSTPQASSTPQTKRLNRSLTLQAVQNNLRPSKQRKKGK